MPASVIVIINAASGTNDKEKAGRTVAEIFKARGIEAEVNLAQSGEEIADLVREAVNSDCEIIVAGGGDGTISSVASEIIKTKKTLGVLPLGTLNHFAKDLGIPLEVEKAAAVIIEGHTVKVDAGEVNGKIFINNSSIGFYASVVHGREQRQRLGHGKWISLLRAAFKVLRRHPFLAVRLNADGQQIVTRTPFVFVGNNEYEMESFNVGKRGCLDAGHLSLYMTTRISRLNLLLLPLRAFFGRLKQAKDFITLCTDEIHIETKRHQLRVAMDGEVYMMQSPLHYRVHPAVLPVLVPQTTIESANKGNN